VQLGGAAGNRESQTAAAGLGGEERLEDLGPELHWNTRPGIAHRDEYDRFPRLDRRNDPPAPGHRLGRVEQHVQNGGPQHLGIRFDGDIRPLDLDRDGLPDGIALDHDRGLLDE